MLREALGYPTRRPHGGRAVLVGGSLLLVSSTLSLVAAAGSAYAAVALLAVIPWLLVRGYYVRVLRAAVGHEHPRPPSFGQVRALLRDGVGAAAIAVAYLLPAAVVLGPLVAARAAGVDPGSALTATGLPADVVAAVLAVLGVVALFAILYLIGALYAIPVAVTLFAHAGRLRAAFDVRTVVAGATSEDYVVAWLVSMVLQVLLLPVAYLLGAIIVGFYLQFVVQVGVRYCYARGVGAALGLAATVPDPAVEHRRTVEAGSAVGAGSTVAAGPDVDRESGAARAPGDEVGPPTAADADQAVRRLDDHPRRDWPREGGPAGRSAASGERDDVRDGTADPGPHADDETRRGPDPGGDRG